MQFAPGAILVFDRGYTDYQWFTNLTQQAVYFVTRLKENADYGVLEKREVPQRRGVLRDEVIFFYKLAQAGQDAYLRRIEFYDEERDRVLVFLTNHLELAAATVAAVYKERWQIELFFRALKQSLRVKTFVGTSANALQTQLWTALIAMLLVKYLQLRSTFGWSLSNLVALLRQQLFVYRDLWTWIDYPFQPPISAIAVGIGYAAFKGRPKSFGRENYVLATVACGLAGGVLLMYAQRMQADIRTWLYLWQIVCGITGLLLFGVALGCGIGIFGGRFRSLTRKPPE